MNVSLAFFLPPAMPAVRIQKFKFLHLAPYSSSKNDPPVTRISISYRLAQNFNPFREPHRSHLRGLDHSAVGGGEPELGGGRNCVEFTA